MATINEMNMDEFARFIASVILEIDHYSFDVLYDVKRIITELNDNRGTSEKAIFSTYHLMVRNTGCDMVKPNDENYSLYNGRTSIIYSLEFCWNTSYFSHETCFCKVTQLR